MVILIENAVIHGNNKIVKKQGRITHILKCYKLTCSDFLEVVAFYGKKGVITLEQSNISVTVLLGGNQYYYESQKIAEIVEFLQANKIQYLER